MFKEIDPKNNKEVAGGLNAESALADGVTVKVAYGKADSYIDDFYTGLRVENDYDCPFYEDDPGIFELTEPIEDDTEAERFSKIDYEPFSASGAIKELKEMVRFNRILPDRENDRRLEFESLAKIRKAVETQEKGIAATINSLEEKVRSNPGLGKDELLESVKVEATKYKLAENQLTKFFYAVEAYTERHGLVEKIHALHPDSKEFFEACFGTRPEGAVNVIKGPMSLHFQCHSPLDYAQAYLWSRLSDPGSEPVTDEDRKRANSSAGAALSRVKIPELDNVVTIENCFRHLKYETVLADKTAQLHNSEHKLYIDAQKKDVEIEVKGFGRWLVRFVERGQNGIPRLQFCDLNQAGSPVVAEYERLVGDESYFGSVRSKEEPDRDRQIAIEPLAINGEHWKNVAGSVYFSFSDITIVDRSQAGTVVSYQELDALPIRPDEKISQGIQTHEERHQFNKLFAPLEFSRHQTDIIIQAAERAGSPDEARDMVARGLALWYRQFMIDRNARDEILAYYRDGSDTSRIANVLENSPLYDYKSKLKDWFSGLPAKIIKEIEDNLSLVQSRDGFPIKAETLSVDELFVKSRIDGVFGDEYRQDIRRYVSAIDLMAEKGYGREAVLTLLSQYPMKNWPGLARRLGRKDGEKGRMGSGL